MTSVNCIHGWGLSSKFWQPLQQELSEIELIACDLGFFGDQKPINQETSIYMTHSMGLCWLLSQNIKPSALIVINGFTKFTQTEDWPKGVHPRILKRMIRQFDRSPDKVWADFMDSAGFKELNYPENANHDALKNGLAFLEESDVRSNFKSLSCPKLVIASENDAIVPKKLTEASFDHDVLWYKDADHLLCFNQPKQIATNIRRFLGNLSV